MLNRGQKRAKENAALSAEPCCAAECTLERPRNKRMHCWRIKVSPRRRARFGINKLSEEVSDSHNHPGGVALA